MTKVPAVLGITQRGSGSVPNQTCMSRCRDKVLPDLHIFIITYQWVFISHFAYWKEYSFILSKFFNVVILCYFGFWVVHGTYLNKAKSNQNNNSPQKKSKHKKQNKEQPPPKNPKRPKHLFFFAFSFFEKTYFCREKKNLKKIQALKKRTGLEPKVFCI